MRLLFFLVFWSIHDAVNHEDKAKETDCRGYFYAAYTEYVRFKICLTGVWSGHKDETEDYNGHPDGQEDKILFLKSKISVVTHIISINIL